jgi:hypothetical protein
VTVPTKWEIAKHWATHPDRFTYAPRMYDLGEPCCFACGWYSQYWDKHTAQASWERATLERAHIVPASMGGPDVAENLLLLCSPCHKEAPDWPDPAEMARWLASRPVRRSAEYEAEDAWTVAAGKVPEFANLVHSIPADRLQTLLSEALDFAGTHFGVGVSQGTREAVLRHVVSRAAQ